MIRKGVNQQLLIAPVLQLLISSTWSLPSSQQQLNSSSSTIPPCSNATGMYSGVDVVQTGTTLYSTPRPASPYASFGKGVGNSTGTHFTFTFESTGNMTWNGQFTGCAQMIMSDKSHASQNWLRNDQGPTTNYTGPKRVPPNWTQDLVMYELNPRGFTSPSGGTGVNGNGAGTFLGLIVRIPYLKSLGVTAVWIAGYCRANNHFFGIWSVYATERPDVLDEDLGTSDDFKKMISAFHSAGLKVFLDVVTHGVTFKAGSEANRTIKVPNPFIANNPSYFYHQEYPNGTAVGKWEMADYDYGNADFRNWWIQVWTHYAVYYGVDGFRLDGPNGLSFVNAVLDIWNDIVAACKAQGKEIVVFAEEGDFDFGEHDFYPTNSNVGQFTKSNGTSIQDACFKSVMFSCHDAGFDQGPGNYYNVKGSRAKLGYQGIFSYFIPVMYAGEESNLDPIYLPAVKKGCYSGGPPGGWYYGLDFPAMWNQTTIDPSKAFMLNDTTKMLSIRAAESDVLHANRCTANVAQVPVTTENAFADDSEWKPYARYVEGKAIIICANPSNSSALKLTLNITAANYGLDSYTVFNVSNLWNESKTEVLSAESLQNYEVEVPKDGIVGGGLAILKIVPAKVNVSKSP